MVTSALIAGCVAGLFAALLHFAFVQEHILLAETYETGAAVHFAGVLPTDDHEAVAHDHDVAATGEAGAPVDGQTASFSSRNAWTTLFSGLVYVAYALILVAGFGLAETYGKSITAREGLLWGIAGYVAFQLAPAMGLAPELPGTMAADLEARQIWWWGTALSTATGLALLGYGRGYAMAALAILLLVAPHVIGAPGQQDYSGVAPPELAAAFSARVLGVGLAVWALLGWLSGRIWTAQTA